MPRTGRPKVEIDWVEFEKLCEIQCTAEEVAYWFQCSVDTIERLVKKKFKTTFAEIKAQKGVRGNVAIRRQMFALALKGNLGALIWLSKNHLGMTDKLETKNDTHLTQDIELIVTHGNGETLVNTTSLSGLDPVSNKNSEIEDKT